jgi:hypothetical protein
MTMTLAERVRDAVGGERAHYEAAGYEGPMPEHGQAGGAKWLVSDPGTEPAEWEGGYVCHCGEVFARDVEQGGMPAAFVALIEHQGGTVAA